MSTSSDVDTTPTLRYGSSATPLLLFTLTETDDDTESSVTPILASRRARAVREIIRRGLVSRETLLGIGDVARFQEEVGAPPPAQGLTPEQERAYLENMSEAEFDQRLMASTFLHTEEKEACMYSLEGPYLPPHGLIVADESEVGAPLQQPPQPARGLSFPSSASSSSGMSFAAPSPLLTLHARGTFQPLMPSGLVLPAMSFGMQPSQPAPLDQQSIMQQLQQQVQQQQQLRHLQELRHLEELRRLQELQQRGTQLSVQQQASMMQPSTLTGAASGAPNPPHNSNH